MAKHRWRSIAPNQEEKIAPTPPWLVAKRTTTLTASTTTTYIIPIGSHCPVPACLRPNCALRSHQQYAQAMHQQAGEASSRSTSRSVRHKQDLGFFRHRPAKIERDGVDGFPYLPINGRLDLKLRELFHHFFENVFDKLVLIFRAPPIPADFKPRMLSLALTNSAYCMGLISQSRNDIDINRGQYHEDFQSLSIYGKAVAIYRKQLLNVRPELLDVMLLVVVILSTYDLTHGRLRSNEMHWEGLKKLVSLRGGIHNVGISLAYVIHCDRVSATFMNKPPAYPLPMDRTIQLMRPPLPVYGVAFENFRFATGSIMTHRSLNHCIDTCRLLELFDSTNMTFDPHSAQPKSPRDMEYFYYSRDRLDGEYVVLHAELHGKGTKEECIITAARIAEYPITWSNYIPTLTILLCTQLKEAVKFPDNLLMWLDNLDVLTWILFVAATAPVQWAGREWAIVSLQKALAVKYGADFPSGTWRREEWYNARRFVWSDIHHCTNFDQVCDEVQIKGSIADSGIKSEDARLGLGI